MPQYPKFQLKPYRRRMSAYWYFDRWPYLKFMLRETSSVFVAYFAVLTLIQIHAISTGPTAYAHFQAYMRSPLMIIVNALALIFVCIHAVTWFVLVPRVMAREVLGKPTPNMLVAAPNFGIWIAASLVVALFVLRII
jgi:fumarate reductase subunit C